MTDALFDPPPTSQPPRYDPECPFPGRWSLVVSFFAAGTLAPGGSKTAFALRRRDGSLVTRANGSPVINMTDAGGEKNKNWRSVVAHEGRIAMGQRDPEAGPLAIVIDFYLPRPKKHFRSNGKLKSDAPLYRTSAPDVLKLARAVEDSLKGILYVDDAQIVREILSKPYTSGTTGANIMLYRLDHP